MPYETSIGTFVHIPKTGGTSVKYALRDYALPGQVEWVERKDGEMRPRSVDGFVPHQPATGDETRPIFTIVRHPMTRLYSRWAKIQKRFDRGEALYAPWASAPGFEKDTTGRLVGASFENFILTTLGEHSSHYWRWFGPITQVSYAAVAFPILRFEDLPGCFDDFMETLLHPEVKLPHFRRSKKPKTFEEIRAMWTDEMIETLMKVAATDFTLLGYEVDGLRR